MSVRHVILLSHTFHNENKNEISRYRDERKTRDMNAYIYNYPRPQFVRKKWLNLNGQWNFAFDDENIGEEEDWYSVMPAMAKIEVPFTYETKKSGIGDEAVHNNIWYERTIQISKKALEEKVVLHFESCDFYTKVWVNGKFSGSHTGGYTRFSFDITNLLQEGENKITVKVEDSPDAQQPRGKQRWKEYSFGCRYIQTTGIWKTVWLEFLSKENIEKVKMTPLLSEHCIEIEWNVKAKKYGPSLKLAIDIYFKDELVNSTNTSVLEQRGITRINVSTTRVHEWGMKLWTPEEPNLYDIQFRLISDANEIDCVNSYFGMREVRIDKSNLLLNGEPLYQRLILDQGYWEDTHLTPPNEEALIEDINKIMEMGYNGIRKHQKTEDERFAYWCDVKGLLMWCEMASPYMFGNDMISYFTKEWLEVVEQNYNHPSIIIWTPFNESCGVLEVETNRKQQYYTEAIYNLTKAYDPYRPVVTNDGWEHTVTDIITFHNYQECADRFFEHYYRNKDGILNTSIYQNEWKSAFADGYVYQGQPIIISEFGGIAFDNDENGWGYGKKANTQEEFIKRFEDITLAIKKLPYICGYCYTQLTDVQQEINGLLDIHRNFKVDTSIIKKVNLVR